MPEHVRSERKKIEYLRKRVIDYEWSKNYIRNIVSAHYSFKYTVTALNELLQLETELRPVYKTSSTDIIAEETLFQCYGRNPSHVVNHPTAPFITKNNEERKL